MLQERQEPIPRELNLCSSHTHINKKSVKQSLYVGIEIEPLSKNPSYCIYVHDGFSGLDYTIREISHSFTPDIPENENEFVEGINAAFERNLRQMESEIIIWLQDFEIKHQAKIVMAGIGVSYSYQNLCRSGGEVYLCHRISIIGKLRLPSRLWIEMDILPILLETRGTTIDERACSAVRKALPFVHHGIVGAIPRILVGFRHVVEVDADSKIHFADLEDYKNMTLPSVWQSLIYWSAKVKERGGEVSFFNSTSRGGGVATMRHSLIRLFRLLNLPCSWYVSRPNPQVFEITKRKMHNVLQGIASDAIILTDQDKQIYESWCEKNILRDWQKGPFAKSTVIVIDDPQLAGTIPWIKSSNPNCKVIFRCHIHLAFDRLQDPSSNTFKVWEYLWSFIKGADAFVFHPIDHLHPPDVELSRLFFMPAFFDPLDGLNKPLTPQAKAYYQSAFNRLAFDGVGKRLNFTDRPIISQFCRFDPSKGIKEVIRAYARLRELTDPILPLQKIPQLLIAGFGSIDDPEGNIVYQDILDYLDSDEFNMFERDMVIIRLPPSDQLINALMESTRICLQLSIKEGFEVKVSEALAKGVPVVAFEVGGIPNQITHEKNGYLVKVGDHDKVAAHLQNLLIDDILYDEMSFYAKQNQNREFQTPFQSTNWCCLFDHVLSEAPKSITNGDAVKDFWFAKE